MRSVRVSARVDESVYCVDVCVLCECVCVCV